MTKYGPDDQIPIRIKVFILHLIKLTVFDHLLIVKEYFSNRPIKY